jgi:hypothetical protein
MIERLLSARISDTLPPTPLGERHPSLSIARMRRQGEYLYGFL